MKDEDDTPAHRYEEKVVSLNLELANLEHALRGAQFLAEFLANNDMPTEEANRQAPTPSSRSWAWRIRGASNSARSSEVKRMQGTSGRRTTPSALSPFTGMQTT